jgi:hypothetical protein
MAYFFRPLSPPSMKTKMSRLPVYGRGGAMYCASGSSWNSSFTTIHMPMLCRRIIGSSMAWRCASQRSRIVICSDQRSSGGSVPDS